MSTPDPDKAPAPHSDSPAPQQRPAGRLDRLVFWIAAGALVCELASYGARHYWRLDLLRHFQLQYALIAAAAALWLLASRRWIRLAVPVLLLWLSGAELLPFVLPVGAPKAPRREPLLAISANVFEGNRDAAPFIDYIRNRRPDLFVVMEIGGDWRTQLESLAAEYPYQVSRLRDDPFGIALFSRVPITAHTIHQADVQGLPSLQATLTVDAGPLEVLCVHPPPPVSREMTEERNRQLREAATRAAAHHGPLLLLGDLNCTPWSPAFAELQRQGGLRNAAIGQGLQPSWPGRFWPLRVPIDHTLVSDGVLVIARRLGPQFGSDHLPVELEFQLEPLTP